MSLKTIFINICSMLLYNCYSQEYEEVLASSFACFSATEYESTIFNAPKNGQIFGIKLKHKLGTVTCNEGDYTYWGCMGGSTHMMVQMLRLTNESIYYGELYYPKTTTQGVSNWMPGGACPRGCIVSNYHLSPYDVRSNEIIFMDPTYNITINDHFMLQYNEGCCQTSISDNVGAACAEVYFLYNIVPTANPTAIPTTYPTTIPTNNPTVNPTVHPTALPTANPSANPTSFPSYYPTETPTIKAFEHSYSYGVLCDNLDENSHIEYGKNVVDCIQYCDYIGEECRMVNYFKYFKTSNDSRCYVFDRMCSIKDDTNNNNDTNRSVISYKIFDAECIDYPYDWRDKIGDTCNYYNAYNWCHNGNILKNENQFYALTDSKYGITAIESCCECNGGINIIDNVALSYDYSWSWSDSDDILCNFTPHYYYSGLNVPLAYRSWDNLVLYEFCVNIMNNQYCDFLINSQFQSNDDNKYSIFICQYNELNYTFSQYDFIMEYMVDSESKTYNIYVSTLWFDIDPLHYSDIVDINYVNHSLCKSNILTTNDMNYNASYYNIDGIHPCFLTETETPTSDPTNYPSYIPTSDPTQLPTGFPTGTPSNYPTENPTTNPSANPTKKPSANPTTDPTAISTSYPTIYPSSVITTSSIADNDNQEKNKDNIVGFAENDELVVMILVAILVICICGVIIMIVVRYRNKRDESNVEIETNNQITKQIEMRMSAISFEHEHNNNNIDVIHRPSASTLDDAENDRKVNKNENENCCILCCDNMANMFNDPCGHVTYCNECAINAIEQDVRCPNCRIEIQCKQIYNAGFVTD